MKKKSVNFSVLLLALLFVFQNGLKAQSIILEPPKGYNSSGSSLSSKLFFGASDKIILNWNTEVSGCKLKLGITPGNYSFAEVSVSGKTATVIPKNVPVSTGRYYGILTNSTKSSISEIQKDAGKSYSNEIQFVVESPSAAYVVEPKGTVTSSTPRFSWTPISGVKAYWLLISSTPFTVVTLPNGDVSVQGANILWNYLTTGTSVQYGDPNYSSPYNLPAPPLVPGTQYSYTVLNVYDEKDVSFASAAFGGVVNFTYQNNTTIAPPVLLAPKDAAQIYGSDKIVFQWNAVKNVNNYTIYLFQRVESFAGNKQQIDIPVWNSTTSNTSIEYAAKEKLAKGKYVWYVVAKDNSDAGNKSASYTFDYSQVMGTFVANAKSAADKNNIIGFELRANAIQGGVSTPNPFIVNNSATYTDSLVAGTYQFVASKPNYYDSSFVYTIAPKSFTYITLYLRPYNSTLSGRVIDKAGAAVGSANVILKNLLNGSSYKAATLSDGTFSVSVPKGSYSIQADKPGYLASSQMTITVDQIQSGLPSALVLTQDNSSVSGRVLNDQSKPVQLATVSAVQGTVTQTVNTDASGNYSFSLSSGQWVISVSKNGFIAPQPFRYTFTAGENLQNRNFILTPKANQVSGTVYKRFMNSTGQIGKTVFAGATVTAVPLTGSSITTVTNSNGEYSFSLSAGTWTISVNETGYSVDRVNQLSFSQDAPQTQAGIDMILIPNECRISGFVTLPDGSGIGDATITAGTAASAVTQVTLSNGYYSLTLPAQTVSISVQKNGYVSPSPRQISLSSGQNISGIDFQMAPNAGVISGKVLSNQQSVADAVVTAVSGTYSVSANTNSSGNYELNLKAGTYSVTASKTGFSAVQPVSVTISAGQQSSSNNFNLQVNNAMIEGSVYSAGMPLNNVQVTLLNSQNIAVCSSVSDINGKFSITAEAGKEYIIALAKNGYISNKVNIPALSAGSKFIREIVLTGASSIISGRVLDDHNQSETGARVILFSGSTLVDSVICNAMGEYTFSIGAGSYNIIARTEAHLDDASTVTVKAGETLTDINFTLRESFSSIMGKVTDASGNAVSDVTIAVSGTKSATAITAGDGTYMVQMLAAGNYNLTAGKNGYNDINIPAVVLTEGTSKELNISMSKAAGTLSGSIMAQGSKVIPEATVILTAGNGQALYSTSDKNGTYRFENLVFGTYEITVEKAGFRMNAPSSVVISGDIPVVVKNITDMLENSGRISGLVLDEDGVALPGVQVQLNGNMGSGSTESDNTGHYEISNFVPGTYELKTQLGGYTSVPVSVTIDSSASLNVKLTKNDAKIAGVVKNQSGHLITAIAQINLVAEGNSGEEMLTTYTDQTGTFYFDNVPYNKKLRILSDFRKPGYVNDTITVQLSTSMGKTFPVSLTVEINNAQISGNVGTGSATVKITNKSTNKVYPVYSLLNGNYELGYLPNGNYTVKPEKPGYVFTPASFDAAVGISDSMLINFNSSSSVGTIKTAVKDAQTGKALEAASVSVYNRTDLSYISGNTNAAGEYLFESLPSGKNYVIRVSADGYTSSPDSVSCTLNKGETFSVSFNMVKNTSGINGYVVDAKSGVKIINASLKLTESTTGNSISTNSNQQGYYSFSNISAGSYTISAAKSGFKDMSTSLVLTSGELRSGVNLSLTSSSVALSGKIVYDGSGVSGVTVTAVSSNTVAVVTDKNGYYSFPNLSIKTNAGDTTIYKISAAQTDGSVMNQTVKIPADKLGANISLPDFVMPSGQIILKVSDGVNALEGVKIYLTKPEGQTISSVTTGSGSFMTEKNLKQGTYRLSVMKENYLSPNEKLLRIDLAQDTSSISRNIALPYYHKALSLVYADLAQLIKLNCLSRVPNAEAKLYFRKKSSAAYTELIMQRTDTTFEASIPAQFSQEDMLYYISVSDPASEAVYTTKEITVSSVGINMLSSATVTPEPSGLTLRKNDSYSFNINLKNGLNESINSKFTGSTKEGSIKWIPEDAMTVELSVPNSSDSTVITVKPVKTGNVKLKILASLKGVSITKTISFTVSDMAVSDISVAAPVSRISNKSTGLQLSYTCTDSTSNPLLLGNNLQWTVEPAEAGTINSKGLFVPADSTYIGYTRVTLQDKVSGKSGSLEFSVYAEIQPGGEYNLTDKKGLSFSLSKGSVNRPIEIYLTKSQFGPAKKYYTEAHSAVSYTVSDKLYNLKYISSIALPGDSLIKPAMVELPIDNSLGFNGGGLMIGLYDPNGKIWRIYNSSQSGSQSIYSNKVYSFGEFALVTENQPLGLHNVCVLPSPFSPEVSPLKIGYILTTDAPPAKVTIRIFNIRGELVRTLLEDDLQYPSKYGSRTSPKEILWDGKTDDGSMVRNGRYVIQTIAKDNTGEKSELTQVVVIK